MTEAHRSIRGNAAMPVILLLVSLVAIGLFGWFYVTQLAPKEDAPDSGVKFEAPQSDEGAPVLDQHSEMPSINGEQPATTGEDGSTAAPEVSSAPVEIDVAKATGVRAIGNVNAPIKIIEYASMTCSHCAHFHNDILPALKAKYIDTGKVYLEFREFPLDDAALKATLTARCLPEDKYESFVALLFKSQEQWARSMDYMTALRQNAKLAGMSDETFDACQKEPMLKLKVAENMQEAKDKWKISATPTFIINDGAETVQGAQPLENFERVFRKLTDGAVGEAPAVE